MINLARALDDERLIEKIEKLEKENENLKENIVWYEKEEDRLREENDRLKNNAMEDMRVQTKLEEENRKLKEELEKTNELLNNVVRCSEQYRGKMISVMEELKMFLYKD